MGISVGQARKSLWIETLRYLNPWQTTAGQARKSLWIETPAVTRKKGKVKVRLVRACGSKRINCNCPLISPWSGS